MKRIVIKIIKFPFQVFGFFMVAFGVVLTVMGAKLVDW